MCRYPVQYCTNFHRGANATRTVCVRFSISKKVEDHMKNQQKERHFNLDAKTPNATYKQTKLITKTWRRRSRK